MAKYFNILTGCLTDSIDGVPQTEEVTELSDLEYAVMQLRMKYSWTYVYNALVLADALCTQVGA